MRRAVFVGATLTMLAAVIVNAQQPVDPRRGGTAAGRRGGAAVTPRTVASVADIMRGIVTPASDVVFGAGGEAPKTDADWEKLRLNAALLADSANLLTMGTRLRDGTDWVKMARAQLDAAEAVVRLAAVKKAEGLSEASDKAYETCTDCHNKYWADRNNPR